MLHRRFARRALGPATCVLLAACGVAEAPEPQPWEGTYDATRVTTATDCASGVPIHGSPSTSQDDFELMRSSTVRLFTTGTCPMSFDQVSPEDAELVPSDCDAALADGTPVHVRFTSGMLVLDGDHLTGEYATETTIAPDCVSSVTTIDATRL
jgi:hypothetical protein